MRALAGHYEALQREQEELRNKADKSRAKKDANISAIDLFVFLLSHFSRFHVTFHPFWLEHKVQYSSGTPLGPWLGRSQFVLNGFTPHDQSAWAENADSSASSWTWQICSLPVFCTGDCVYFFIILPQFFQSGWDFKPNLSKFPDHVAILEKQQVPDLFLLCQFLNARIWSNMHAAYSYSMAFTHRYLCTTKTLSICWVWFDSAPFWSVCSHCHMICKEGHSYLTYFFCLPTCHLCFFFKKLAHFRNNFRTWAPAQISWTPPSWGWRVNDGRAGGLSNMAITWLPKKAPGGMWIFPSFWGMFGRIWYVTVALKLEIKKRKRLKQSLLGGAKK